MKRGLKWAPLVIGLLLFAGCSRSEPSVFTLIKLSQSGKHDEVIELAEKFIAVNPDNSQAHRFLVESAVARNEGEIYREKYQKLAEANPTVAGYRLALGYVNLTLGDLDTALAELRKAIKLNPNIEYAHYLIGWIYIVPRYSETSAEKGLAEWEKEIQLNPRSLGALQVYAVRADYHLRVSDADAAIEDYQKVAMYGFARDDIKDARGLISRIRNLRDELARLEAEVKNNPDDVKTRLDLGKLQYKNSMVKEALETWQEASDLDPDNAEIRNFLGKSLIEEGRHEEAVEQLQKAVELDPSLTASYYNLAVAEDYLGRTLQAIEHYGKYIELNPMAPKLDTARQRISELREKTGEKDEG
jgi:tetratricopeptide (TPR) repeat protein